MTAGVTHWRIERYDTLDSTSDVCGLRAAAGEPAGLMVLAGRQTSGRGRAGRQWNSPEGNFYGSVLLRPNMPAGQGGWYALLAGLSLIEALDPALPTPGVIALKWPNDVMAGGAKLAGILLDATIENGLIASLVIGVGVNLAAAPDVPGRATTSLASLGGTMTPEDLAPSLCARLDHWLGKLAFDSEPLRQAWIARAHPEGTALTVDGGRRSGTYAGLDKDGALLLREDGRVVALRGGDVSLI
ncbi:biotin--[acetyl-CoA-carboxylase] ligase [Acidiphilium sp. C61]|uniref:biotin--[acetyl-CoA-carboxylase] ligase n=1 Tax=Acidiphilium sp. C61 TaxID=1671485 RepID=UPI00157AD25F|nr:biotin--[acetyl-CoA-carboxylase] ligase [Acidiphilium sp. C61]